MIDLAAKNSVFIVEFVNPLRDQGVVSAQALKEAALTCLRPIVMTGVITTTSAVLLVLAGPGFETRSVLALVVLGRVLSAIVASLLTVPTVGPIVTATCPLLV